MAAADRAALETILRQGLAQLDLDADRLPVAALLDYLTLLARWNRAYNLTAIRDPAAMISRHLLDSLAVLPCLHGRHCLDLGSGAGLPGMVLALADPGRHWTLLDSNAKKVRFLRQVQLELRLPNVDVVRTRIEDYRPPQPFSCITARAVAGLARLWAWTAPLLAADGRLLALKGDPERDELAALESAGAVAEVRRLRVPGANAPRCLITVRRGA